MAACCQQQGGRPTPRRIGCSSGPLGLKIREDWEEIKGSACKGKVESPDTPCHDVARARLERAATTDAGVPQFMRASITVMPGHGANCLPLALRHVLGAPPNPAEAANFRGILGSALTKHADKLASGTAGET